MERILILGGGVGGTLTANLLARRLHRPSPRARSTSPWSTRSAPTSTSPGSCTSRWAASARSGSRGRSGPCSTPRSGCWSTGLVRVDEPPGPSSRDGERSPYDYLVLATGSRIVPEEIPHFAEEADTSTPPRRRSLRQALDAFTGGRIVIGIASMPYKCPPAPLEVASCRGRAARARAP